MTDETRAVPDTSKTPSPSWLLGGNPEAILAQEAQGQQDLVASTQLPVDGTKDKEGVWNKIGIEFGPITEGDIFRNALLPEGWKKRTTDHSMWNELVDANGVVRAMIFYKAAFYDRSARVRLECRYWVERDYEQADDTVVWIVTDRKTSKTIFYRSFDVPDKKADSNGYYDKIRDIEITHGEGGGCKNWLEEHHPDYQDEIAYWEDE